MLTVVWAHTFARVMTSCIYTSRACLSLPGRVAKIAGVALRGGRKVEERNSTIMKMPVLTMCMCLCSFVWVVTGWAELVKQSKSRSLLADLDT